MRFIENSFWWNHGSLIFGCFWNNSVLLQNIEQWNSQQESLKMRTSKSKTFQDSSQCTGGRSSQLFWYRFFVFVLSFFLRQKMRPFLLSFACLMSLNSGLGFVYRFPDTCHYSFFSQRTTALKNNGKWPNDFALYCKRAVVSSDGYNDGWTFGTKTNLTLIGNTKDMCMTMQRLWSRCIWLEKIMRI